MHGSTENLRNTPEAEGESPLECARRRIRDYIRGSRVPEDPRHAENTLHWLLRLDPSADPALQLAALAHDIDRASPEKIRRERFDDYDTFKTAHAEHGARILAPLLEACGVAPEITREACRLVRYHETGGDPRADLLRDADSLSYFDVNLPLYHAREGDEETLRRCIWGIRRLSPRARTLLERMVQPDEHLRRIVARALAVAAGARTDSA